MEIKVFENNIEKAMTVLKKKLLREGLFRELKRRNYFEKPSERKKREKLASISRYRKALSRKQEKEGL